MSLFGELKRRNVFRVGIAYAVLSWLLLQVTDVVVPILELPEWVARFVLFLLAIGFPLVLFFAWAFELTPEGLKREKDVDRSQSITPQTGKKLDRAIIVILGIAVMVLLIDRFWLDTSPAPSEPVASIGGGLGPAANKSVAVLPFVAMSTGTDDEFFADGLTEEILNSLAQLPELLVTARTSAFHFKGKDIPIAEIATTLGVRHIVEGSVRRSGERLRITAQLIRAEDGFHLWSQNYDRDSADTIAVQEDIAEQIATSLDVVLDDERREAMRQAGLNDVVAFIEYQKAMDLYDKAHGDMEPKVKLLQANELFESVLERVPGYAPAYLAHSDLFVHQLFDDSTSNLESDTPSIDIDSVMRQAIDDYTAAVQYARTPQERGVYELDLAVLSGNWRGLSGRLEQVFTQTGCASGNWLSGLANVFGFADRYLARTEEFLACDPLVSTMWFNRTRAALWSGDPQLAIGIARQGLEVAPGAWLNHALIRSLAANSEFEAAQELITSSLQTDRDVLISSMLLAAARGDAETAARHFERYREVGSPTSDLYYLLYHSWTGDLDTANQMAAKIDKHPVRHQALAWLAYWCACGAPFDLEATPNFAAKIEEAGFSWPPSSPIEWPLKEW